MLPVAGGLTQRDLIECAQASGVRISRAQLARWQRAGLLPQPTRVSRGRGRGIERIYPRIAAPQAVAVARAGQIHRHLDSMAWEVWLQGFPVTPRIRSLLERQLRTAFTALMTLADAIDDDTADDVADAAWRTLAAHRPPVSGRIPRERFDAVNAVLLDVALGRTESLARRSLDEWKDIVRGFISAGVDTPEYRARLRHAYPNLSALREGDVTAAGLREMLVSLSAEIESADLVERFATVTDDELEQRRTALLSVWQRLRTLGIPLASPSLGVFFSVFVASQLGTMREFAEIIRESYGERSKTAAVLRLLDDAVQHVTAGDFAP